MQLFEEGAYSVLPKAGSWLSDVRRLAASHAGAVVQRKLVLICMTDGCRAGDTGALLQGLCKYEASPSALAAAGPAGEGCTHWQHWARALGRTKPGTRPWLCHSPTAIPVTQIQCPRGMTLRSARCAHVCSTLARVKALTSRALSTSVSSRCCLERRRACTPAGIGTACRVTVMQLAGVCPAQACVVHPHAPGNCYIGRKARPLRNGLRRQARVSSRSCLEQARHSPLHSCRGEGRPALQDISLGQITNGKQAAVVQQAVKHAAKHECLHHSNKGARLHTWLTFWCQQGHCAGDWQCSHMQGVHNNQPIT